MSQTSQTRRVAAADRDTDELIHSASLPPPERMADALRKGQCTSDRLFDRYLPDRLRFVSGSYWTPLVVALRVAEWLEELNIRTVVDIGSGAGKFCVATALASRASFTGIEQRAGLVHAARDLAQLFNVDKRVSFIHCTLDALGEMTTSAADAYYLYNPFEENLFGPDFHLDNEVELSDERFCRDVAAVERLFGDAPVGTYVITYNGYGGKMPATYQQICVDRAMPNMLRMWQKIGPASSGDP